MVKPSAQGVRSAAPATPASFEAALAELESIVQRMETGAAPLEESLAAYERGMLLLKHCQDTLTVAERKLQVLENGVLRDLDVDADGSEG